MPRIEFVRQSSRDADNRAGTTERLVNFYPEPVNRGGRAAFSLRNVLGAEDFSTLPGVFARALANIPDANQSERLFCANNSQLISVDSLGVTTGVGAIVDDAETSISGNNGDVTVVSGGNYYRFDGATVSQPAVGAFSSFGSVDFLRGYTLLTEKGGRQIQWSALADASSLPGLNFATAEGRNDVIIRGVSIGGNFWVFKETSIEVWQNTGLASEEAFSSIPGLLIEVGLKSFNLVAKFPGGAFFVGSDDVMYLAAGTEVRPVSGVAVNTAIRNGTPTHCNYHEDEAHKFLTIRFGDRPAWVYDFSTELWHERASGEDGASNIEVTAHAFGKWRGAGRTGKIYAMDRTDKDGADALIRRAVSMPLENEGKRFRVNAIEFMGRVGRLEANGGAVTMMIRATRDGGNSWGTFRNESMGALGEHETRMETRNWGMARQFAVEVRVSDPVDATILSAANVRLS